VRLLADSHVLLWWLDGAQRLSEPVRDAFADPATELYLSAASIWELAVKQSVGKLEVDVDLGEHAREQGFTDLPVTFAHAAAVRDLPFHHRDPFDRMLVAQARVERLTLVTADSVIPLYDVAVMPA
jgi:PIN domain nuclease of toxin-antitoxin system